MKKEYKMLLIILAFSIILNIHYINFNMNLGIYCSDVYIYLLNALYYAGLNINSTKTIYLSPVICFLTSLLFRLGLVDRLAIYIITGIFAIAGNIGIYFLLKTRFNHLLSLTGTIIYATLSLNLTWLANGSLDVAACGVSIWIILTAILAFKKNSKYYMLLFPLFIIGVFTRYTVILLLPGILLYYLTVKGFKIDKKELKPILIGIIISLLLFGLITISISQMSGGHNGVANQINSGINGSQGSSVDPAYNTDVSYYLVNYLNFLSNFNTGFVKGNPSLENSTPLAWAVLLILIMGLVTYIKNKKIEKKDMLPITLFIIAILTFTRISSTVTIVLTLLGIYFIAKSSESKVGYMMLAIILTYMIYHSYYDIKVNRYILPTFAPLIYLFVSSLKQINVKKILPVILIILFIIQGFAFTQTFDDNVNFKETSDASDYIIHTNPDYKNLKIGVYNLRPFSWYLGSNVTGIPTSNTTAIDSGNVTYYISNKELNLSNYSEIQRIDKLYLYEKITN